MFLPPMDELLMDEIDKANESASRHLDYLVQVARGEQHSGPGAPTCAWCEEDIPMERRKAVPGCTLCVTCQSQKERLKHG